MLSTSRPAGRSALCLPLCHCGIAPSHSGQTLTNRLAQLGAPLCDSETPTCISGLVKLPVEGIQLGTRLHMCSETQACINSLKSAQMTLGSDQSHANWLISPSYLTMSMAVYAMHSAAQFVASWLLGPVHVSTCSRPQHACGCQHCSSLTYLQAAQALLQCLLHSCISGCCHPDWPLSSHCKDIVIMSLALLEKRACA